MQITALEQQLSTDSNGLQLSMFCQQLQHIDNLLQQHLQQPALSASTQSALQQQYSACSAAARVIITLAQRYQGASAWPALPQ